MESNRVGPHKAGEIVAQIDVLPDLFGDETVTWRLRIVITEGSGRLFNAYETRQPGWTATAVLKVTPVIGGVEYPVLTCQSYTFPIGYQMSGDLINPPLEVFGGAPAQRLINVARDKLGHNGAAAIDMLNGFTGDLARAVAYQQGRRFDGAGQG